MRVLSPNIEPPVTEEDGSTVWNAFIGEKRRKLEYFLTDTELIQRFLNQQSMNRTQSNQHGDFVAQRGQQRAECFNEGRLPGSRRPRQGDAERCCANAAAMFNGSLRKLSSG